MIIVVILSLLSAIALLSDAYTTYHGIRKGFNETNPIRLWLIEKLGIKAGTFGVALALSLLVAWINFSQGINPTVVFMNIVVVVFSLYATLSNRSRMSNR